MRSRQSNRMYFSTILSKSQFLPARRSCRVFTTQGGREGQSPGARVADEVPCYVVSVVPRHIFSPQGTDTIARRTTLRDLCGAWKQRKSCCFFCPLWSSGQGRTPERAHRNKASRRWPKEPKFSLGRGSKRSEKQRKSNRDGELCATSVLCLHRHWNRKKICNGWPPMVVDNSAVAEDWDD